MKSINVLQAIKLMKPIGNLRAETPMKPSEFLRATIEMNPNDRLRARRSMKPIKKLRAETPMKPTVFLRAIQRLEPTRMMRTPNEIKPLTTKGDRKMSKKKVVVERNTPEHVAQTVEFQAAERLAYLAKTYDSITSAIAKSRQRLCALGEGYDVKYDLPITEMESTKGKINRQMEKELAQFPAWSAWLEKVPGVGPFIGANLILMYNFRHIPVCKDCGGDLLKGDAADAGEKQTRTLICKSCGKASKDDGVLKHRIERRDFPNISKWWAYMGRHTVEGVMPKRKAGVVSNWNSKGRVITYLAGESFNKMGPDHHYKAFMLKRKAKHEASHPDWSKGHIHNAAKNETVKLLLAHFWQVSRTLEGLPVTEPYAGTILGHTGIIAPFYWEQ